MSTRDPRPACSLDEVIVTAELSRRPSRAVDFESENRALSALADAMALDAEAVLQALVESARELTGSDSAGLSVIEECDGGRIFRWKAIAGDFAQNVGGVMPYDASPCGVVVERGEPLLFNEAERHFPALREPRPKIFENLLVPFHVRGKPAGTLWAIKHREDGRFEAEDVRLLVSLARFASAAHQTSAARMEAQAGRQALDRTAVARNQAEEALSNTEERFRLIVENARDYAIFTADADRRIDDWHKGAELVFGWTAEEMIGQLVDITFTPEDRAEEQPEKEARIAAEQGVAPNVRWHIRKDGSRVFIDGSNTALRGPDGSLRGFLKIGQDVTERRAKDEALQASEARMRSLVEGIPQMVFRSNGRGRRYWGSPQWVEFTGLPLEESVGLGWLEAIHPDDREATLAAWEGSDDRSEVYVEHRVFHAASGHYRWHQTRAAPLRGEEGRIVEWLGTSTEVEEIRSLYRHQQTLLAELQHRVRNTLAVVRSIARRTAETSDSVEEMAAHLQGRLDAFSRVQAVVTRNPEAGIGLAGLVEDELLAHAVREGERLTIEGEEISLKSRPAETLSLAIHELATNAVKYGALSSGEGLISVQWARAEQDGQERLKLVWRESGVDMKESRPGRQGFGLELLQRTLPYDLRAETRVEFGADGLRFTLDMPLGPNVLATEA
jgi:PAS domain S-box-containing protein